MIPIRDTVPSRCAPVGMWGLIALNILAFWFQRSLPPLLEERFVYLFGIVPVRYSHPAWAWRMGLPADDWWPFLTHMFLHANWPHLIGNMWTLWIFGDNVEDRMGTGRFLLFYLLGGVAAGAAQFVMAPNARVPMVGASGAVAAVLGAYFWLFPRARVVTVFPILFYPFFFALPAATYLLFWFLSQGWAAMLSAAAPARSGGVAWWAHVGGFVFGLAAHRLFLARRRPCRRRARDEYGWEEVWNR